MALFFVLYAVVLLALVLLGERGRQALLLAMWIALAACIPFGLSSP